MLNEPTKKPETSLTKPDNTPLGNLKRYCKDPETERRMKEILGARAGAFMNSIVNVVKNSDALQKCEPGSIMTAAIRAATYNLSIDPALGQAAIVPYNKSAQFQIMYKGVTQLCIRSGQYATIHCTEVYKDEIKSWNAITGEIEFTDPTTWKMRQAGSEKDVAGHYAKFKLLAGFEKSDYMTVAEALAHAKKYSKAYQYDLRDKKKSSLWSNDPIPMGNKTILLRLLTRYGIMSIEMQDAFIADNQDFASALTNAERGINADAGSVPVDAEFEEPPKPLLPDEKSGQAAFLED